LVVKDGVNVHHPPSLEKFNSLANQMGFSPTLATKVYAISNKILLDTFGKHRGLIHHKHQNHEENFKKDDWLTLADSVQRRAYLTQFAAYAGTCPWKHDLLPKVIPMLQGTSEKEVWQICQNGLSKTGETDSGYYGSGVYFTSKLSYASQYAKADPGGKGKPFVLAVVTPGNLFPVVEKPSDRVNYRNQGCRNGYQSHFTIVDGRSKVSAFPIQGPIDPAIAADELIIFQEAQALPIFVFYTD